MSADIRVRIEVLNAITKISNEVKRVLDIANFDSLCVEESILLDKIQDLLAEYAIKGILKHLPD